MIRVNVAVLFCKFLVRITQSGAYNTKRKRDMFFCNATTMAILFLYDAELEHKKITRRKKETYSVQLAPWKMLGVST